MLASVHEMILRLPTGYETDLGLHGERISQGQRQRLGLARALYGDPSLIVLDEPNANLDNEGDLALMKALARLRQQGRTVLMVTHQGAALQIVDKVLMLVEGNLAAFGDRDPILKAIMGGRRKTVATAAPATRGEPAAPVQPTLVSAE